jgi:hypothetical protein
MKPKEKAKELVLKFLSRTYSDVLLSIPESKHAKQCALIAVDELIEEVYFTDGYYNRQDYWQEVKQEIVRTVSGVLLASATMASNDYFVQIAFALLTFYLIYRELKSDKELSE